MKKGSYHMNILVSIIIPIYNIEKNVEKCIDSVINQTYKDLEIILVDDGSTDSSGMICDNYGMADSRIHVVHQANAGLSAARNKGIDLCKGSYIFFLDGDDWIDVTCIQKLLKLSLQYNADITDCNCYECYYYESLPLVSNPKVEVMDKIEAQKALLYLTKLRVNAWGKLYKKEIFNDIRFPEGKLFEDQFPSFLAISTANTIIKTNEPLYAYVRRNDSILQTKYTSKNMDAIQQNELLVNYVSLNYPSLKKAAESRLLWESLYIIVHIDSCKKHPNDYSKCKKYIERYRRKFLFDPNISNRLRSTCYLSLLGYPFLRFAYNFRGCMWSIKHKYRAQKNISNYNP